LSYQHIPKVRALDGFPIPVLPVSWWLSLDVSGKLVCVRLTNCWSGGAKRKTSECPYSQPHGSMGVPTVRDIIQPDRHLLISILGAYQRTFITLNRYTDQFKKSYWLDGVHTVKSHRTANTSRGTTAGAC